MAYFLLNNGDKITFEGELQIEMLSPLFYDMNSYSLPGKIPNTPENSRALERPDLINSINNKIREYEAKFISNNLTLYGVIRVSEVATDDYFNFNFTGQGAFWAKSGSNKMNEEEYESFQYPSYINSNDFPLNDTSAFIFENAYAFVPHFNSIERKTYQFFNEKVDKLYRPVNHFHGPNDDLTTRVYDAVPFPNNPWLLLRYIVNKFCDKIGFTIRNNSLDQAEFDYLLIYNNYNIEQLTFSETSYRYNITNIEVIDDKTLEITTDSSQQTFLPSDFIKLYNFTIDNKNNINGRIFRPKETSFGKFQIEIDTALFSTESVTANCVKMYYSYAMPSSFEIGRNFPNLTSKEFFTELNKIFGLKLIPGESIRQVDFILMEDIISDNKHYDITSISGQLYDKKFSVNESFGIILRPVEDDYFKERVKQITSNHTIKDSVLTLYDLPLSGNKTNDVRYVSDKKSFYLWNAATFGTRNFNNYSSVYIGNWEFFSEWIDYGDVSGDMLIESKFSPIPKYRYNNNVYGYGRELPKIEIATNHENSVTETDGGIRFMFFETDIGFPIVKSENNYLSLLLHGDKGIYNTFHKKTIDWKINRYKQCKSKIQWPVNQLNNFAWDKKYRIKDTNYLVEKIPIYIRHDDRIRFGDTELART